MANFLFNDMEFPGLPWSEIDKSKYSHAAIAYDTDANAHLIFGESPFVMYLTASGNTSMYVDNSQVLSKGACLVYDLVDGAWVFYHEYLAITIINGIGGFAYTPIWCSTDILYVTYTDDTYDAITYGDLYLAASTPVYISTFDLRTLLTGCLLAETIMRMRSRVEPEPELPDTATYLRFSAAEEFTVNTGSYFDGMLYWSTDTVTWNEYTGPVTSAEHDGKHRIYMRGIGNTIMTGASVTWSLTGSDISCDGNIENLLDYEVVSSGGHPTMGESCFYSMFYQCANLVSAPKLPATDLANMCYGYMFADTSITKAPELPATSLAEWCYYAMFQNTPIVEAPQLPATTLAERCYWLMLSGCTRITTAPELPATALAKECYGGMLSGCTGITEPPALPATELIEGCYSSLFSGCTNLLHAPELPAMTLAKNCYRYMFQDCISLTMPPKLPATTLGTYCYQYMFRRCTGLNALPKLPALTLPGYCYQYMFFGCTGIKLSETQVDAYQTEYRVPISGEGTANTGTLSKSLTGMFGSTGGTKVGTPTINTTYYTSNAVV